MGMIDNAERREVAAKLRAFDIEMRDWDDYEDEIDSLESAIDCNFEQQFEHQNWWHRLADLIDRPTCHNVTGYQDVFDCSECRCRVVQLIAEVCNEYGEPFSVPLMPSYCPNCGAKVER